MTKKPNPKNSVPELPKASPEAEPAPTPDQPEAQQGPEPPSGPPPMMPPAPIVVRTISASNALNDLTKALSGVTNFYTESLASFVKESQQQSVQLRTLGKQQAKLQRENRDMSRTLEEYNEGANEGRDLVVLELGEAAVLNTMLVNAKSLLKSAKGFEKSATLGGVAQYLDHLIEKVDEYVKRATLDRVQPEVGSPREGDVHSETDKS